VIVVVAGVAGSGKTTVGKQLADRLNCVFADGDDFHPANNVAKMDAGIPLTDDDRWPWLRAIASWMDDRAAAGESAVVACSVLRRAYREVLLAARARPRMMFLVVTEDACAARLDARRSHFFGPELLGSQFTTLELPQPPEPVDLVPATGTPQEITDHIMALLGSTDSLGPTERLLPRATPNPARALAPANIMDAANTAVTARPSRRQLALARAGPVCVVIRGGSRRRRPRSQS
jgi:gluconokinase